MFRDRRPFNSLPERFPEAAGRFYLLRDTRSLPDFKGAVTVVPEAVVEIVSEGSELKDFEIGPVFYLAQGVKDVLVLDPDFDKIIHHSMSQRRS